MLRPSSLSNLRFETPFLEGLTGLYSTITQPTPVQAPELLIASPEVTQLLGLTPAPSPGPGPWADVFSGNTLLPDCQPYSTRYGGHQFGHWAGQLGDGRAISLGERRNAEGELWEVQLKGAGPTPYSRRADGRAVLRSSLREFLCSEAMHHLGVPTTRALCCVTTGETVIRDLFYDGHPEPEPGAITTRVAPSFLRFGHFEMPAHSGEVDFLRKLVNRTIERFYPGHTAATPEGIAAWFEVICRRTAFLMSEWLRVGFVHGVMNTDNLSILGLTLDYGPYGWMDIYDPSWTPNTTDAEQRRYAFGKQPGIALWNLARLAEALLPIFPTQEVGIQTLTPVLERYNPEFQQLYINRMGRKLGLSFPDPEAALHLLKPLEDALTTHETDYTLFYRLLADVDPSQDSPESALERLREAFYSEPGSEVREAWLAWLKTYITLTNLQGHSAQERRRAMNAANPVFILRNCLVQEALDALQNQDRAPLDRIFDALKTPYQLGESTRPYFKRMPEWARNRPGCSALSCSS
jgi:uncharacterized protein YdiU (UPF0061 family)